MLNFCVCCSAAAIYVFFAFKCQGERKSKSQFNTHAALLKPCSATATVSSKALVLPERLEDECFSFLSLLDLTALFWVSRAFSARMPKILANQRHLHLRESRLNGDWFYELHDVCFPLVLAFKHCRRLQTIVVDHSYTQFRDVIDFVRSKWLPAILKQNANTLTSVNVNSYNWTKASIDELARCPHLQQLEIERFAKGKDVAPTRADTNVLLHRVATGSMPGLKSLSLSELSDLEPFLSQGVSQSCHIEHHRFLQILMFASLRCKRNSSFHSQMHVHFGARNSERSKR